jgi:MerR family transcriptional regulator, aldehyde-responsive regulator
MGTLTQEVQYTVKDVAEITGLSKHTIRYYDNEHLIPFASRNSRNIRVFTEHDLDWIKMIHCLRTSGLPIAEVKSYIEMCVIGDQTIPQRAELVARQEQELENKIREYQEQLAHIKEKKLYYESLCAGLERDRCNPILQQFRMKQV